MAFCIFRFLNAVIVQLLSVVCKRRTDEVALNEWLDERTCLAKLDFSDLFLLITLCYTQKKLKLTPSIDITKGNI